MTVLQRVRAEFAAVSVGHGSHMTVGPCTEENAMVSQVSSLEKAQAQMPTLDEVVNQCVQVRASPRHCFPKRCCVRGSAFSGTTSSCFSLSAS